MPVRQLHCPSCQIAVNVPTAMASAKCPSCGEIFDPNSPAALNPASAADASEEADDAATRESMGKAAIVTGLVGGAIMLLAMVGLTLVMINRKPDPSTIPKVAEDTIKPAIPEEYRVIKLPEEHRKRIYKDCRTVARTTLEVPLMLPQGTRARQGLENTLQMTFDRELMHFAALHDITVDDVKEVIKEGDAKAWDGRARSNAVRDGKRVYTKEMSEGWEDRPNKR